MADKIDQITINGTSWDIDLPPDATPSIDSLTASSKVEVKTGTSNNLGYAALTTDLISSNKYEGAVEVEQGSDAMLTKKATSYYADRIVLRQGINQPATLNLPPISYGTTKTLATTSDMPPTVSGTDDGTNWTSLTIGSTTKNIPAGGGSTTYKHTVIFQDSNSGINYQFVYYSSSSTPLTTATSTTLTQLLQNEVVAATNAEGQIAIFRTITGSGKARKLPYTIHYENGVGGVIYYDFELNYAPTIILDTVTAI